jgi:hypothetical protein
MQCNAMQCQEGELHSAAGKSAWWHSTGGMVLLGSPLKQSVSQVHHPSPLPGRHMFILHGAATQELNESFNCILATMAPFQCCDSSHLEFELHHQRLQPSCTDGFEARLLVDA